MTPGVAYWVWNELTSDCTTRYQPSAATKSSSLNGSEIRTGGSITMPIADSAADTTRSMTMNGMKITNPIRNAARSSEMTNAGMSVVVGTSSGFAGCGLPDIDTNSPRSFSRTCLSMNVRNG